MGLVATGAGRHRRGDHEDGEAAYRPGILGKSDGKRRPGRSTRRSLNRQVESEGGIQAVRLACVSSVGLGRATVTTRPT